MSLSVKRAADWLSACFLGIALVGGGLLAGWWATSTPVAGVSNLPAVPAFSFQAPETSIRRQVQQAVSVTGQGEPFGSIGRIAKSKEEKGLDLQEVHLEMIVVTGSQRTCLVNGRIMREGQEQKRFMIERIEPQGVWFRTTEETFRLTVGERVRVAPDGGRQQQTEDERAARKKHLMGKQ